MYLQTTWTSVGAKTNHILLLSWNYEVGVLTAMSLFMRSDK